MRRSVQDPQNQRVVRPRTDQELGDILQSGIFDEEIIYDFPTYQKLLLSKPAISEMVFPPNITQVEFDIILGQLPRGVTEIDITRCCFVQNVDLLQKDSLLPNLRSITYNTNNNVLNDSVCEVQNRRPNLGHDLEITFDDSISQEEFDHSINAITNPQFVHRIAISGTSNQIHNLNCLSRFTKLSSFYCQNFGEEILQNLPSNFRYLKSFEMHENRLSSASFLNQMPNLEKLFLHSSSFENEYSLISPINNMTKLRALGIPQLQNVAIVGNISHVVPITQLAFPKNTLTYDFNQTKVDELTWHIPGQISDGLTLIDCSQNPQLKSLNFLLEFPNLTTLHADSCKGLVDVKSLESLENLAIIDLRKVGADLLDTDESVAFSDEDENQIISYAELVRYINNLAATGNFHGLIIAPVAGVGTERVSFCGFANRAFQFYEEGVVPDRLIRPAGARSVRLNEVDQVVSASQN